ncbi:hypothetical protein LJR220_003228 [Bradyrhizobium sp. LjRoot220]|uniref:hypothetical protein n=1 Tax=Bradyrhizobium sp. LjRoot220 TaxID=3342284 RepID=UPI003ECC477F
MVQFTGWREPISISGAGKVVDGILRRRPCFFALFLPTRRFPNLNSTSQAGDCVSPALFAESGRPDDAWAQAQMRAWFRKYGVLS